MSQQCEAAKDASIISGSSLRGRGARTVEGMSCGKTGACPEETKLNRSSSACCEVWLHGRGACLEKGRLQGEGGRLEGLHCQLSPDEL